MAVTTAQIPRRRTREETILARVSVSGRAYAPVVGRWLLEAGGRLRRLLLTIAAIVCAVVGMGLIAVPLGFLTAAAGFLWLEYATTPPSEEPEP